MPERFEKIEQAPTGRYATIIADPPWKYLARGQDGYQKSPQAHYGCEDLSSLKDMDVARLGRRNTALVLWAIAPMLDQAFELMAAWGFRYVTAASWAKASETGQKWAFGPGHVLRGCAEFILIGAIGYPERQSRSVRNFHAAQDPEALIEAVRWADTDQRDVIDDTVLIAPKREHSRKPDSLYRWVEALYAGPYVELFSREIRGPAWDSIGDEAGKFDGGVP